MNWIPLESNPDVLNEYLIKLGVETSNQFCDIWSLDEEMLAMIPPPVKAIVVLFPITKNYELYRAEIKEKLKTKEISGQLFFVQQTIQNACGTIGLIHALANTLSSSEIGNGTFREILFGTRSLEPKDRAAFLETLPSLASVHKAASLQGQTEAPDPAQDVDLHFVCFVEKQGDLYELDGRNEFPFNHGKIIETGNGLGFVTATANIVKRLMALDTENVNFTTLAFGGKG